VPELPLLGSAGNCGPAGAGGKPNGLALLLPIFGGAIGGRSTPGWRFWRGKRGLGRFACVHGQADRAPSNGIGAVFFTVGGAVPRAGRARIPGGHLGGDPYAARATPATRPILCRKEYAAAAPADRYAFTELKPTELSVTRRRAGPRWGRAGALPARTRGDKWLVATWRPALKGTTWWRCCPPIRRRPSPNRAASQTRPEYRPASVRVQCRRRQRQRPAGPLHGGGWMAFRSRGLALGLYLLCSGGGQPERPDPAAPLGLIIPCPIRSAVAARLGAACREDLRGKPYGAI